MRIVGIKNINIEKLYKVVFLCVFFRGLIKIL